MALPKYIALLRAVELGSISQAAASMGYTQPAVSRMIADVDTFAAGDVILFLDLPGDGGTNFLRQLHIPAVCHRIGGGEGGGSQAAVFAGAQAGRGVGGGEEGDAQFGNTAETAGDADTGVLLTACHMAKLFLGHLGDETVQAHLALSHIGEFGRDRRGGDGRRHQKFLRPGHTQHRQLLICTVSAQFPGQGNAGAALGQLLHQPVISGVCYLLTMPIGG